jgi:NDP-sugar pyrophosphorylase family protein
MNTALVIMAAGMGSRYGGLKQLETVGPNGEAIIDYSVYDAAKAGFDQNIFIIREEIIPDFESFLINRYPENLKIDLVLQENAGLINPGRTKPWGTAHAVLAVKDLIKSPFAILNADDFYGRDAFVKAFAFLNQKKLEPKMQALIGYRLSDTLSSHGSVSRGICKINDDKNLDTIREILNIEKSKSGEIFFEDEKSNQQTLDPNALVSMNFWCLQPCIFDYLNKGFSEFLVTNKNSPKAEYLIPTMIKQLIESKSISVKVESTKGPWFGITYKEDKAGVCESILKLTQSGTYPSPLWK